MLVYLLAAVVFVLAIAVPILAVSNAKLWVKIIAMEKSTHTLTYIDPMQQQFQKPTKADVEAMTDTDLNNLQ